MSNELKTMHTGACVYVGTQDWFVSVPTSPFAAQLVAVNGIDTQLWQSRPTFAEGSGSEYVVGVPADQLDLLIEALTIARDEARRAGGGEGL